VRNAVFLPEGVPLNAKIKSHNVSPEVTLTYKPQSNQTIYVAYKTGFQSGGMTNPGLPAPQVNANALIFEPEKAKGEEIGYKFSLQGGTLRGSITAYNYKFDNLQVQSSRAVEVSPGVVSVVYSISNAATAYTRGVEAEGSWVTPVEGLEVNGFLGYNLGYYKDYRAAPCYFGQTAAQGCLPFRTSAGVNVNAADLTDSQLPNAPMWTARLGVSYEHAVSERLMLGLTADANYNSAQYLARPNSVNWDVPGGNVTDGRRGDQWLFNASARVYSEDKKWEFALIGRNIFDKKIVTTVGNALASTAVNELVVSSGDPRTVTLQLTYHY
jgi:outer membrane receptor protein involved in Fe transport